MSKFIYKRQEPPGFPHVLREEDSGHKDVPRRTKPSSTGGIVDSEKYMVMSPDPDPCGTSDKILRRISG